MVHPRLLVAAAYLLHEALHRSPAEANQMLLHRQFQTEHPVRVNSVSGAVAAVLSLDVLNELCHQFLTHF